MKKKMIITLSALLVIALAFTVILSQRLNSSDNKFEGKKIVTYGDSITWGQSMPKPPYVGRITWPNTFEKLTGTIVTNMGWGGTNMSVVGNTAADPDAMCNRIDSDDLSNYDYIFICYGANDCNYHTPIGDDSTPYLKTTFKGALNYTLSMLAEKYPDLEVILITPMFGDISLRQNSLGLFLTDYSNAVLQEAKRYNVTVIDLQNDMGINADNYQSMYWDGALHPTEATYEKMGEFIAKSFIADMK